MTPEERNARRQEALAKAREARKAKKEKYDASRTGPERQDGRRAAGCVEEIKEANRKLPSVGNRSNPEFTEGFVRFGVSLRWVRF